MIIQQATTADIEIIQSLARKSWTEYYTQILSESQIQYMLWEMYNTAVLKSQLKNHNYHYFIFRDSDETPIGFIGYEINYETETTKLHRIYFLKNVAKSGYGTKAMEFLKKQVSNAGNNRIILNVNKHNSAQRFYEKQGFLIYDEGVFDIGNGYFMDDYLMQFHLNNFHKKIL